MEVSIIIVNYKSAKLICDAIQSVKKHTKSITYEIIVVDNASCDDSEVVLSQFDDITFLKISENVGFGRANNFGAQKAKGKYLFLLNPDTILLNNAVKIMFDEIEKGESTGIVGCNLYDINGWPNFSYMMSTPSIWTEIDFMFGGIFSRIIYGKNATFNYTQNVKSVGYVTGAALMLRSSLMEKIGGFCPEFFMYYEEAELTNRVRELGLDVKNVPNAKIIHLEGKTSAKSVDAQCFALKSRRTYMKKKYGEKAVALFFLKITYFCICIEGMLKYKLLGNKEKFEFWKYSLKNY